jgi:hypothetical protein
MARKSRQASVLAIEPPDRRLVARIREEICPAMMLAGADAYEAWANDPELADDVGELVSRVYGAMRAQEIARDQQMWVCDH